jgi:hypothetical protein
MISTGTGVSVRDLPAPLDPKITTSSIFLDDAESDCPK